MSRMTTKIASIIIVALATLSITSCADATGWYPEGTASVAGSYELDDAGARSLVVTATLENTGASTISRSTFTITAVTGAHTYWKTVTSETRILPGAKVKVASSIAYAGATESLKADGLSIGDAFFE